MYSITSNGFTTQEERERPNSQEVHRLNSTVREYGLEPDWVEAHWTAADRLAAETDAPLLTNPRTGRRWSHWALRKSWLRGCKAAGLPPVPYYEGTKHSGATEMLARTQNLEGVREYLGHSDTRSTRKYAHLTSEALVEIAKGRKS